MTHPTRAVFLCLAFALGGCVHAPPTVRARGPLVSLLALTLPDPVGTRPLHAAVFAPPLNPVEGDSLWIGPYAIQAREDLPIAPGRHPLVVLSHGHAGSRWGHHDLAVALAQEGYIVAAVEHAGDSWDDQSAFRSDRSLIGRPYQVSAVIDAVLADPRLGPLVDPARIGVAGFSAGGYTALALVGAIPDFFRVAGYCQRHPRDPEICGGPFRHELELHKPLADPRIRAAFLMAPLAIFFGPDAFEGVHAPVFLASAQKDSVLLPAENANVVLDALGGRLLLANEIPRAEHGVFLAPCSDELKAHVPLCLDPPGVDRAAIHAQLQGELSAFFSTALSLRDE